MSNASFCYYNQLSQPAQLLSTLLFTLALVFTTASARAENMALKLDGNGSYVEIPDDAFTNLKVATIEGWVRWDEFGKCSRFFDFSVAGQTFNVQNRYRSGELYLERNRVDVSDSVQAPDVLSTGDWVHVAAVVGPDALQLFLNGVLIATNETESVFSTAGVSKHNYLGRSNWRTATAFPPEEMDEDFKGEMDEIRVWNYRRTASQIREGMFKRMNGDEGGLVHLWNFDSGTARDATARAADGKLIGNAVIVPSDLHLTEVKTPPPAPVVVAPVPQTPPQAAAPVVATQLPLPPKNQSNSLNGAALWIAGAVTFLALVLAWLAFMFRRSGLGSEKIVGVQPVITRMPAEAALPERTGPTPVTKEMKDQALAELTSFAKESLVQGLFSQRAALLEAQKQAHQELAQLEARLANLDVHDRILAYESRIADLEQQITSRGEQVEKLTKVTLQLLRKKLAEEKEEEASGSRFN